MEIATTKNGYIISFPYRPHLVEAVKGLTGKRFNPQDKSWFVPSSSLYEIEKFALRYGFVFVRPESREHERKEVIAEIPELPAGDLNLSFLKVEPYPFQKQGIQYAIEKKRLIIGDQPGLGKTLQSMAAVVAQDSFPCLVICPASIRENWRREWIKFTHKKVIILNDSVKNNYHLYYQSGITDVFIVNYESLKKYFVYDIQKDSRGNITLKGIRFREQIKMFKSIIIDELHRCFPYDTEILTSKGYIKIGEIVENKLENLLVASFDLSKKELSFQKILTHWKNKINGRQIWKLTTAKGSIEATEDHEVYINCGRKAKISEVKSGDYVWHLREIIRNDEERKNNCQVLRQVMFSKVENETGFDFANFQDSEIPDTEKRAGKRTNEVTRSEAVFVRENDPKQSNEKLFSEGETKTIIKREENSKQRRERQAYIISNGFIQCDKITGQSVRVSSVNDSGNQGEIKTAKISKNRHSNSKPSSCNRSRWSLSQKTIRKICGSTKNRVFELIRVESCEVYEQTNRQFDSSCDGNTQFVYDLEIETNHNYFANGYLVSNCKSNSTQQAKFVKGLTTDKEVVIGLTGTPVVNKPKDLLSQLSIINRLVEFGGYRNFMNRYCAGMNEASNLKELNSLLRTNCFVRREKHEVLKDLPAKQRQTVICEINNRVEYAHAENDLVKYLREYKQATDQQIRRSMRGEVMVRIGVLKNISARGKLKSVFDFVDDVIDSGEKLVLFVHLKEVSDAVNIKYPDAVLITGGQTMQERQRSIDSFQQDSNVQLIICSIKAAGVGITLTAASRVGFIEFPWTFADCEQCEDRTHRIGQENAVTAYYFLGQDTIDEKIYQIIQAKKSIAQAVTGSTEEVPESVIDMIANLFNQPSI